MEEFLEILNIFAFGIGSLIFVYGVAMIKKGAEGNDGSQNSFTHGFKSIFASIILMNLSSIIEVMGLTLEGDEYTQNNSNIEENVVSSSLSLEYLYYALVTIAYLFIAMFILGFFLYLYQVRKDKETVARLKSQYFEKIDDKIMVLQDSIIKKSMDLIEDNINDPYEKQVENLIKVKHEISKIKLASSFDHIKI